MQYDSRGHQIKLTEVKSSLVAESGYHSKSSRSDLVARLGKKRLDELGGVNTKAHLIPAFPKMFCAIRP